ncbi:hypothetical protein HMPREF0733_10770 [Rothia dentocariosa ATCC 17931]|uniref:Uncharacterized protein n=1 Tax=Rothia dentocariosa (strain ATCC 17931 / CDC X599 / XDIA) TaxID=762948 RepID=E3H280_ROTDC|nr:hypothetical protein HMPREF0733_10770 [Rothia dentocariosa ATCC 17931]
MFRSITEPPRSYTAPASFHYKTCAHKALYTASRSLKYPKLCVNSAPVNDSLKGEG